MSVNIIQGPAQGHQPTVPKTVITPAVQGGNMTELHCQWLQADGVPFDLTGATLTATRKQTDTHEVFTIEGDLTITNASLGLFTWSLSDLDTAIDGVFRVQFKAAFADGVELTYPALWRVLPQHSAEVVAWPLMIGVPQNEADYLALLVCGVNGGMTKDDLGGKDLTIPAGWSKVHPNLTISAGSTVMVAGTLYIP